MSDIEPGPQAILAHHHPDVPNLGDITKIDWTRVEPVDVICGGSPCTDLSMAGARAGMSKDTRSGLWESMFHAITALRPRLVVWEDGQPDLFSERSGVYSEILPPSGMTRRGQLFMLPTLERPTSGPESSLLLTPTANLGSNGGSQPPEKRREGGHGPTLADLIEHLDP